jgi:hypothetical protein
MLDRQKLETLLTKRFPGARHDQIAAAANAIMGLDDEWEEVADPRSLPSVADHDYRVLRRRVL